MKESLEIREELEGKAYWVRGPVPAERPLHSHEELELNLVVRGTAEYLVDGRRLALREGALLWLFPSQSHALSASSDDFEMWVYVFRPRLLKSACKTAMFVPLRRSEAEGRVFAQLRPGTFEHLRGLCENGWRAYSENADLFNGCIRYLLLVAWQEMRQSDGEALESKALHPSVFRAAIALCREPARESLTELARQVGLSSEHLSRLFKKQMGQSLSDYRSEQRFRAFREIYGEGIGMNILEASLAAGFGSYAQFYRIHIKKTGKAPSEGRRGKAF
ncbi:AraC family transcriptional regulator [Pelagicoccus sp. SDUM812005]|uniref:AraC family transcriptional regulator n=1 Tax=Pelagicoccus sp. SDUM812005 TaxID=3041257 RepID=UPI00280DA6EC|nr:AraC family transcriptional regulator [Pelagicoccus sp. SDUM812005]MDQ8179380.1 AraC family transcriptional regulator [Pelagicoccus sp. SDUM812005]